MDIKTVLTAIGLFITIVNYIPYIVDIFRGKTRPHLFSWFVWALLTAIAFAGQVADHGGVGTWVTGVTAASCFGIAVLALKYGEKEITRSDWVTFVAALLAVPLWLLTKTPLYSMILITVIDALAFYPTFRKSWAKPQEETLLVYFIATVKFALGTVALEHYSWVTILYPISIVVMNSSFIAYVLWRRVVVKKTADREEIEPLSA